MLQFKRSNGNFGVLQKSKSQKSLGMKIETEHAGTYKKIMDYYEKHKKFPTHSQVYEWISGDHTKEDPKYYTKLIKYVESKVKKSMNDDDDDKNGGGKKASPEAIKSFIKKNPNPSDKLFHEWAEKNGYDIKDAEGKMYKLATKQVKKSGMYLDLFKAGQIKGKPGLLLTQTPKGKRWKRLMGKEESPEKKWAKKNAYPYKAETLKEIIEEKIKDLPATKAKDFIFDILETLLLKPIWGKSDKAVYDLIKAKHSDYNREFLDLVKSGQIKGKPGLTLQQTAHGKRWKKIDQSAKNKISGYLSEIGKKYHKTIPLNDIEKKFNENGHVLLQEDNTEYEGFLTGAKGRASIGIANKDSKSGEFYKPTKQQLHIQWFKMPSGKYEINGYIS